MFEWLRKRFERTPPSTGDEEERAAALSEREHQEQGRRRGESYIRSYAEPLTNYRPDPPPLPRDDA